MSDKTYSRIIFSPENGYLKRIEKDNRKEICLNGYWEFQGIELPENYQIGNPPPDLLKYDNVSFPLCYVLRKSVLDLVRRSVAFGLQSSYCLLLFLLACACGEYVPDHIDMLL